MKPPRIPSIFRLGARNENRQFNYKPRIYDEQKEKLEKRRLEIEKELAREKKLGKVYESHLRERIGESWSRKENHRQKRNSNVRLLLILGIIVAILYVVYGKFDFSL